MRNLMAIVLGLGTFWAGPSWSRADEPLTERDLPDNVTVKLVAARRSGKRTVHLIAKFETVDKDKREVIVEFHTRAATPHERTLMNVSEGCVGGCGPGAGPEWKPTKAQATFSVPKDGVKTRKDFEKCYLFEFTLPKGN